MRASLLSVVALLCLLVVAGCGASSASGPGANQSGPHSGVEASGTETLAPNSPWRKLWTLPTLPPAPQASLAQIPQIAWSPANGQRLYACRVTPVDSALTTPQLHNLYRSNDQGLHWTAYPLPEDAASCRVDVDPTNSLALVLQDNQNHTYVSRNGGQSWQALQGLPEWNAGSLDAPVVQIMSGRVYAEGYWSDDLTHWTRWYPGTDGQHVYVQINPQDTQTLYTSFEFADFRCAGAPFAGQLSGSPFTHLAELCRSEDGGQSWRFLAVVDVENSSNSQSGMWSLGNVPDVCLVLNHPEMLYALGYTAPGNTTLQPAGFGDPMRSTDGGATWTSLPSIFVGNDTNNLSCSADGYAGQGSLSVDPANATGQPNQWGAFGITAEGDFYHIVDTTGTRQGVTMSPGVSLLTDTGWQVIAPYPVGVTTPFTNSRLRMLLMTPLAGASVLLAFTDQNLYRYSLSGV